MARKQYKPKEDIYDPEFGWSFVNAHKRREAVRKQKPANSYKKPSLFSKIVDKLRDWVDGFTCIKG